MTTWTARRVRTALTVAALVAATVSCVGASASSLGGLRSAQLFAQQVVAPVPLPALNRIYDSFTGATDVAGRVTETGHSWAVHHGAFAGTGTQVASTSKHLSTATVDPGVPAGTVAVTLTLAGKHDAGLVLASDATGANQLQLRFTEKSSGTVTLLRYRNGDVTALAQVTGIDTLCGIGSGAATLAVTVTRSPTGTLTGRCGVPFASYTLTPADQALFGALTRVGFTADDDRKTLFDDFSWTRT